MITKNDIKFIQSLKQTKFRKENKMFVVEGNKLVSELLASDFKVENILVTETWLEKFPEMASSLRSYEIVNDKQMEQMSSMVTPPGIIATAHTPSYSINPEDAGNEFILALDGINDPGNLGTMIRTADWFGINKIVCSQDCADAWQAKTIQSTMGSIFRIQVIETDLREFLIKTQRHKDAESQRRQDAVEVPTANDQQPAAVRFILEDNYVLDYNFEKRPQPVKDCDMVFEEVEFSLPEEYESVRVGDVVKKKIDEILDEGLTPKKMLMYLLCGAIGLGIGFLIVYLMSK